MISMLRFGTKCGLTWFLWIVCVHPIVEKIYLLSCFRVVITILFRYLTHQVYTWCPILWFCERIWKAEEVILCPFLWPRIWAGPHLPLSWVGWSPSIICFHIFLSIFLIFPTHFQFSSHCLNFLTISLRIALGGRMAYHHHHLWDVIKSNFWNYQYENTAAVLIF